MQVRLVGLQSNRQGIGARVNLFLGDRKLIDEVHSGRGYQSHFGTRLYFGLAEAKQVDRLEVYWPNGTVDVLKNIDADQPLTIFEGSAPSESSSTDVPGNK